MPPGPMPWPLAAYLSGLGSSTLGVFGFYAWVAAVQVVVPELERTSLQVRALRFRRTAPLPALVVGALVWPLAILAGVLWLAALVILGGAVRAATAPQRRRRSRARAEQEAREEEQRRKDEEARQQRLAEQTLHREAPLLASLDRFCTAMDEEPLFTTAVLQARAAYWEIRAVWERANLEAEALRELQHLEAQEQEEEDEPAPAPEPLADPGDTGVYVRDHYGVPAYLGGRITMQELPATIVGFAAAHLVIRFDGTGEVVRAHPTWRLVYVDPAPSLKGLRPPAQEQEGTS